MKTHGLTPQRLRVARLVADGKTDKEVGEELGISKQGVWFHVRALAKAWNLRGNVRVLIANRVRQNPEIAA